jgi:hypothetical protein
MTQQIRIRAAWNRLKEAAAYASASITETCALHESSRTIDHGGQIEEHTSQIWMPLQNRDQQRSVSTADIHDLFES